MWQSMKWSGAAVTVLLLVAWVGSAWYTCTFGDSYHALCVESGQLSVAWGRDSDFNDLMHFEWKFAAKYFGRRDCVAMDWSFRQDDLSVSSWKGFNIPIWFLALLT